MAERAFNAHSMWRLSRRGKAQTKYSKELADKIIAAAERGEHKVGVRLLTFDELDWLTSLGFQVVRVDDSVELPVIVNWDTRSDEFLGDWQACLVGGDEENGY